MSITVTLEHLLILIAVSSIIVCFYGGYRFRRKVNKRLFDHDKDIESLELRINPESECVNNSKNDVAIATGLGSKQDSQCTIDSDGTKEWHLNGRLHRIDGPAREWADGTKEWYINGKYHREDGPSVECANGDKTWYINGKCHRTDGPAIEYANGTREWCLNDKLHKIDGPAIECANGTKFWWIEGKELTEEEFNNRSTCTVDSYGNKKWTNKDGKYHRVDGPAYEDSNGSKYWYLNGELHRENGPAIEHVSGKFWYLHGKRHRENGPAVEWFDGDKAWYLNDKLHREDGPAIERIGDHKVWYIEGKELTEEEFNKIDKRSKKNDHGPRGI